MSPVPRRWPAAAFLICCSLLAITDRASALPGAHPEASLGIIHDDATFFEKRWQDPHPGSKAYVGFHERGVLDLVRRDCLPNGTNFCFGDSVNFCSNCGTCCTDGLYCCGSGGICCNGGCCASGQTCDQGRCLSADGPVTVTSVAYETITHIATQTATVLVVVVDTSTIVQTTESTISNAETQTNTVWVTTTAVEKRSLPTLEPELVKRGDDILVEPRLSWTEALRAAWTSVSARRLPHAIHDVIERRQATREPSAAVAPSTVTVFATETVDFTSVVSTTITQQTTSFVMTTVIMTNTIVLNARTTIDVTSTMTITSRLPVTQVITTTQSPVIITGTITAPPNRPPTTGATSSSSPTIIVPPPAASSSSIQTSAIVGIAVGGTVAAIIVASIVIFFIRHRRKHASSENPNADLPPDVNQLDREPTFPVLTHFAPTATAAHHASGDFTPPTGQYLVPNTSTKTTPSPGGSHHRSSSNYSTLVSTPYADAGGGGVNKNYRVSAMTAASATGSGTGEVVHEMDTAGSSSDNPSPGTNPSGTRSPPPPVPPPRNPYRGFTSHIVQTEPGELDSNEKYEIGPSRREDSDGDDDGLLRVPGGIRGQRSWSEEQRYDGDGYGTPDSRSPSVPPINWGKAL